MNDREKLTIGILGGMGTYATVHIFKQFADIFAAEKEWDRPRIIIDNRCTMPSRVRAFLYGEKEDTLVEEMTESLMNLKNAGCNRILLGCNTAHLFLPQIFERLPELQDVTENAINNCVAEIQADNVKEIFLLASEGTIESKVYQRKLDEIRCECLFPKQDEYGILRNCIEAVKQNKYTEETKREFKDLINGHQDLILGCTELPILYEMYQNDLICGHVYDPMLITLEKLKQVFKR